MYRPEDGAVGQEHESFAKATVFIRTCHDNRKRWPCGLVQKSEVLDSILIAIR
jgi:hypothetical protein